MKRPITLEQAKAMYQHRYTMEHLPQWAVKPHYNEDTGAFIGFYKPQYVSDAEWYAKTTFPGEGDISARSHYCESNNQTWPLGKGFSAEPCVKGQRHV